MDLDSWKWDGKGKNSVCSNLTSGRGAARLAAMERESVDHIYECGESADAYGEKGYTEQLHFEPSVEFLVRFQQRVYVFRDIPEECSASSTTSIGHAPPPQVVHSSRRKMNDAGSEPISLTRSALALRRQTARVQPDSASENSWYSNVPTP